MYDLEQPTVGLDIKQNKVSKVCSAKQTSGSIGLYKKNEKECLLNLLSFMTFMSHYEYLLKTIMSPKYIMLKSLCLGLTGPEIHPRKNKARKKV